MQEEQICVLESRGVPRIFSKWALQSLEDSEIDPQSVDLASFYDHSLDVWEQKRLFRNKYLWSHTHGPSVREQQRAMEAQNEIHANDPDEAAMKHENEPFWTQQWPVYCLLKAGIERAERINEPSVFKRVLNES